IVHLLATGNPAPPRPRRPAAVTSSRMFFVTGWYPPAAQYSSNISWWVGFPSGKRIIMGSFAFPPSRGGEWISKQPRIQQLVNQILQRWIDAACQSFHRSATLRMRSNVIHVLAFNACVPDFLRIQNDIRSGLAAAEAHVWLDLDTTRVL